MNTFRKFFLIILAFSPLIYGWLVQLRVTYFTGWSSFQYIAVFVILSFFAFLVGNNDNDDEIFTKGYGKMLIVNAVVYIAMNWIYGIIGPSLSWAAILLGIWYILLAIYGILLHILVGKPANEKFYSD